MDWEPCFEKDSFVAVFQSKAGLPEIPQSSLLKLFASIEGLV